MPEKSLRILIVDDDEDILANLSDILNDLGYQTDTATCGEDAIGIVQQFCPNKESCKFDLCLLDFKMPGIDGVELYEKIVEFNPQLRAIMITAYAGDDGVQRAVDAGTWKVLRKPVDIELLLGMIRDAVV
ncbi:response regulator [Mariniblastus fucicola]|uniref:Sporulation initiation phosphotransferase F n=1 Tax=Mariniblastus fucicola TaxID=980251 RepID=A0A5B9P661_9BACT|nr:response regulator [Mariniblastus fucicola]QEG20410.1 Sporulation initiation phosphotransferase F [Mariniblastus fucicola]